MTSLVGTLDWMPDALRAAGLTVVEYPDWQNRATSGSFAPRGVIWHHDASAPGPSPNLPKMIAEIGNATTPPPLAQTWVDTAGTWHITAGGRANHAGIGAGWGRIRANRGNEDAIGVETDHTTGEPWPAALLDSLRTGTAVILRHLHASPTDALCGHREYAPGRKTDPAGLDLNHERWIVAELMEEPVALTEKDADLVVDRLLARVLDMHWKPPGATDNHTAPIREILAWTDRRAQDTNALIAAVGGKIDGLAELVRQLAAGEDLDLDAIRAAAHTGTTQALAEGTVHVDIDITAPPQQGGSS